MNHRTYQLHTGSAGNSRRKSRSNLGIRKIDRYYDKMNSQLILIVSMVDMLDRGLNTYLKEDRLILEASFQPDFNRPYRTHLVGTDPDDNYENEISSIGFCEIKLKPGYAYSVLSQRLVKPSVVKIVLKSDFLFGQSRNGKNGN